MKKYVAAAALSALMVTGAASAYAGSTVTDAGYWVVGKTYSQPQRCTGNSPGQGVNAPPSLQNLPTCMYYDCSSLTQYMLKAAGSGSAWATGNPYTYDWWPTGSPDKLPSGHAACDPSSGGLCVGFTHWGEDGKSGPGHVVISVDGTVYEAVGSYDTRGNAGNTVESYRAHSGTVWTGVTTADGGPDYNKVVWVSP